MGVHDEARAERSVAESADGLPDSVILRPAGHIGGQIRLIINQNINAYTRINLDNDQLAAVREFVRRITP